MTWALKNLKKLQCNGLFLYLTISHQTFVGLEDVLKTSSTRLQYNNILSYKRSWICFEDVLKTPCKFFLKMSWKQLAKRVEDVLKTSWKAKNLHNEDVLKTSWRHLEDMSYLGDMSWRRPENMSWEHLQDVLETKKFGISISQKSKCLCI